MTDDIPSDIRNGKIMAMIYQRLCIRLRIITNSAFEGYVASIEKEPLLDVTRRKL